MSPCVLKSCICTDLEYCEGSVVPYVISFDDTVSANFRSGCRFCFERAYLASIYEPANALRCATIESRAACGVFEGEHEQRSSHPPHTTTFLHVFRRGGVGVAHASVTSIHYGGASGASIGIRGWGVNEHTIPATVPSVTTHHTTIGANCEATGVTKKRPLLFYSQHHADGMGLGRRRYVIDSASIHSPLDATFYALNQPVAFCVRVAAHRTFKHCFPK